MNLMDVGFVKIEMGILIVEYLKDMLQLKRNIDDIKSLTLVKNYDKIYSLKEREIKYE